MNDLLLADSSLGGRHGESRRVQQLRSSFAAINAQSCNHSILLLERARLWLKVSRAADGDVGQRSVE